MEDRHGTKCQTDVNEDIVDGGSNVNEGVRRLTKKKRKSGLSLELAVWKGSVCRIAHEEDEDLVYK